jgi:ribosomal protein S18 acetylase RimI-like enzyme
MIDTRLATPEERAKLLAFMRDDLADDIDSLMQVLGITWPEFERVYASRGEVRAVTSDAGPVGYYWMEQRGRELHHHAILVLPEYRGRGVVTMAMRALEEEFRGKADVFELGVRESNEGARSPHRREGFVVTSTRREIGFVVMHKQIGDEPLAKGGGRA